MSLRRNARGADRRLSGLAAFGANSGPAFTPASIAGLALWLRGDSGITTVNGGVTQWVDNSPNAYVFTGHGTAVISFQGTGSATSTTVTVSEAVSVGDTIIVGVAGVTTPTDNAAGGSNTYVALQTSLGGTLSVYGCVSAKAASAGALIITGGGASLVTYAHYSGAGAFGSATNAATGATSAPNAGNVTPASTGQTIVSVAIAATVETAGAGYALRAAGSATAPSWQDLIGAGTGSTATAFGTSATAWSAAAVTMVPANLPPTYSAIDAAYASKPTLSVATLNSQSMSSGAITTVVQAYTLVWVGQSTNTSVNGTIFQDTGVGSGFWGAASTEVASMNSGSTLAGSTSIATPSVVACVFNGASSAVYVNNSQTPQASGAAGSGGMSSGFQLGGSGLASFMTGKWASYLLYTGALTSVQLKSLFAYLGAQYGIAVS